MDVKTIWGSLPAGDQRSAGGRKPSEDLCVSKKEESFEVRWGGLLQESCSCCRVWNVLEAPGGGV